LISPTFRWIRLAERVTARVHLFDVPDDIKLRVGTMASVLVQTSIAACKPGGALTPVPRSIARL
jgi:multidrug resistance efflux pump